MEAIRTIDGCSVSVDVSDQTCCAHEGSMEAAEQRKRSAGITSASQSS